MADIALMSPMTLPESWKILVKTDELQIALMPNAGQYPVKTSQFGSLWIVLLSHVVSCEDVYGAMRRYGAGFLDALRQKGVVSGIILNEKTSEYVVFRDIFGTIPWMIADVGGKPATITTSPQLHEMMVNGREYNRSWMAQFLWEDNSSSYEDVFEGTRRIRPGESWIYHREREEFISLDGGSAENTSKCLTISDYWKRRNYQMVDASYKDLVHGLYEHLISAAGRIPSKPLCFTLSGGLDSTGVVAAWCKLHPGHAVDTCSLVSAKHRSCDESYELDVLNQSFPMHQIRVNMDDALTLSRPELYSGCRAYGPLRSPGIEPHLACLEKVEQSLGPRMIITGYGGNYLVNVRPEALFRHLFTHLSSGYVRASLLPEIMRLSPSDLRNLLGRRLGNMGCGELKRLYHRLFGRRKETYAFAEVNKWFDAIFAAQFPEKPTDPVSRMSHSEERAWIPQSWCWEENMRALDWLARQTNHSFYDALMDPVLYDYCAQIPPQMMQPHKEYRKCYKDALSSLLPAEIINHPKVQYFDETIHDGLGISGKNMLETCLSKAQSEPGLNAVLDVSRLISDYHQYTDNLADVRNRMRLGAIWRPLSLCLWGS